MSEEKKEDATEQQTFLNEHEELLQSINKNKESVEDQDEVIEEVAESVTDEAPAAENDSATMAEPAEKEPEAVEEPVIEKEKPAAAAEPAEPPVTPSQPAPAVKNQKNQAPAKPAQHSPQHEEVLRQQALEQSEVKEVLVFFRKYAKPAGIVIIVICALILADRFFKSQRFKKEAAADAALMQARGVADLQEVVDKYASTPAGPIALMELAREKFNAGEFDEAEALYTRFTKEQAKHELAEQAELNLITCKEAKGRFDEAHQLYGDFAAAHEGSRLAPSALLGQARCLEAQGKLNEAQIAYEDIVVNFPDSAWSRIAEANLKTVISRLQ